MSLDSPTADTTVPVLELNNQTYHNESSQYPEGTVDGYHAMRPWSWEILSLAFASGILVAIIIILCHFNGQEIPQWPLRINLNTIIALLSTVFRASTLVAVSEIIGQLRWAWFRKPRPLFDMHQIDRAGYGALGAMRLLPKARENLSLLLGVIIVITSIAIGPFAQQSVRIITCERRLPDSRPSIPAVNYINHGYTRTGAAQYDIEIAMKGAMINGLTDLQDSDSTILFSCETGNCTFPAFGGITHSSIGLCSRCIDSTSEVRLPNDTDTSNQFHNYSLPIGLTIWPGTDAGDLSIAGNDEDFDWASAWFTPEFSEATPHSILNVTMLSFTTAPCSDSPLFEECPQSYADSIGDFGGSYRPLAVACTLYPCLRNYHATVANGRLNETLISSAPAPGIAKSFDSFPPTFATTNYTAIREPCLLDFVAYDSSNFSTANKNYSFEDITINGVNTTVPYECLYKMNGVYSRALYNFLSGTIFAGTSCGGDNASPGILHCPNAFWILPIWNEGAPNLTTVSTLMDKLTTAITNRIRENGSSLYVSSIDPLTNTAVIGVASYTTACVEFDWQWLLLPVMLLILSAVLLALMVVSSHRQRRQPVWKSSSLPLLIYGFGNNPVTTEKMDKDRLERWARKTYAFFRTDMRVGFERLISAEEADRQYDLDSLMDMTPSTGNQDPDQTN